VEETTGVTFEQLSNPTSTESSCTSPSINTLEASKTAVEKKSIAIHIRSKSLSRPRDRSTSVDRRSLSRIQGKIDETLDLRKKQQMQNVEKWNQLSLQATLMRSREVALAVSSIIPRQQNTTSTTANHTPKQEAHGMAQDVARDAEPKEISTPAVLSAVVTTSNGQPICVLCKRKFPSIDLLRRHEGQSELHRTNLAKRKADELAKPISQPEPVKYQDRAKKRRFLHSDVPILLPPKNRDEWRTIERAEVIDPEKALSHENVGNQLFQKMLNKASTSNKTTSVDSRHMCETMKEDWRRIESISQTRLSRDFVVDKTTGIGY